MLKVVNLARERFLFDLHPLPGQKLVWRQFGVFSGSRQPTNGPPSFRNVFFWPAAKSILRRTAKFDALMLLLYKCILDRLGNIGRELRCDALNLL